MKYDKAPNSKTCEMKGVHQRQYRISKVPNRYTLDVLTTKVNQNTTTIVKKKAKVSKMLGYILGAGYPHHIGHCALVADFSMVDPKIRQLISVAPNSTALQCLTNIHSKLY